MPASTPAPAPDRGADQLPPNCGPTTQQLAILDAAIAAAIPAFGSLAPNASADIKGRKHSYLNLPGLLEAVRPALLAQQVIITNSIGLVPGGFVVATTLRHSGGGWRLSQFPVLSLTSNSAIGSAATSGFRVNLQLLLGICASDEEAAHEVAPQAPAAAPSPMPWQPPAAAGPPAYAAPPQQGYDMTMAAPPQQAPPTNALQWQPAPTDPSAYV
jgi:hypothetical protein